jgi:hypothetical protein
MAELLDEQDLARIRRNIQLGLQDRKKYEPLWQECLAFASGRQYVKWSGPRGSRQLVSERPKPGMERYTVELLAQYRQTVFGELSLDDDRPQLLFRHDDLPDEEFADQANDAVGYGWDYEWESDRALSTVRQHIIDVGTGAVRCCFDPTLGPVRANVPHYKNEPVYDLNRAMEIVTAGGQLSFKDIHEGRVQWEAGSAFNVITPPGVPREWDFPWECWADTVYLPVLRERFGDAVANIKPDSIQPLSSVQPDDQNTDGQARRVQLQDQAWLYTYYDRPTPQHPDGRVIYLASERMIPVQVDKQLPYKGPDGGRRSGVHYFHYIRLSDRFWSRSMMELGLQPARAFSKRRTQIGAIYDRGQPKVIAETGTLKKPPSGYPCEVLWLEPGKAKPEKWDGISPSNAMYEELESLRTDLERAIGLRVTLGENPPNVPTYSQLALLREQETRKLDATIQQSKQTVARLIEDSSYDIGRYWGRDKQIAIAGPDGQLKAFSFNATSLQEMFYRVETAKGAAKPRTQAAQLQLITDLWNAALNSGVAKVDPVRWLAWLKESYEHGKAVDMPTMPPDYNQTFVEYAKATLAKGELPPLPDYIDPQVVVPAVREVETDAILARNEPVVAACQAYLQILVVTQQGKMAQSQADQAAQPGLQIAAGPGTPPVPSLPQ